MPTYSKVNDKTFIEETEVPPQVIQNTGSIEDIEAQLNNLLWQNKNLINQENAIDAAKVTVAVALTDLQAKIAQLKAIGCVFSVDTNSQEPFFPPENP